jgi:histidyl-tRNA synthetase
MIYEHEIPEGSRLYFGQSASLKREIETDAANKLTKAGFEEIVSPFFSYHQHLEINERELLRFSDEANRLVSLRADSTLDVVRLITRRLGRVTRHKKWFYIQPVFRYPSFEYHQIGGELIGEADLSQSVCMVGSLLERFSCKAYLQISHIAIPKTISKMLDIPLEVLKSGQLETLLAHHEPWLSALATLQSPDKIDSVLEVVPQALKAPLLEMKALADACSHPKVIVAPLYYAKMRYYDTLFFRFVAGNKTLGSGGQYAFEEETSSGFGVYTDALIETLMQ